LIFVLLHLELALVQGWSLESTVGERKYIFLFAFFCTGKNEMKVKKESSQIDEVYV